MSHNIDPKNRQLYERLKKQFGVKQTGRPKRTKTIQKDEVLGLRIDLEVFSSEDIFRKYFSRAKK
jgi:hypothetical protein